MNRSILQIMLAMLLFVESQGLPQARGPTTCHLHPVDVVFRSANFGGQLTGQDNCSPYPASLTASESEAVEYVSCRHPIRLTDSSIGPITYTQEIASEVYTWGSNEDQLLFVFAAQMNITSINLFYYSNMENQGHSKLRFYAVPDDFDIRDTIGQSPSYPKIFIDEAPPRSEETGLRNVSREVHFQTTRVLLTKSESKNYKFVISEIEFLTCDPATIVTESTTTSDTTTTTTTTSDTASSLSTDTTEVPSVPATLDGQGILVQQLGSSGQKTKSCYPLLLILTVCAFLGIMS